MRDSSFSNNSANFGGGGLSNFVTLTVSDSSFTGNFAGTFGGGIFIGGGTATVSGSTITGNSAGNDGGGIYNLGTVTVSGSTITGNSATNDGGGIFIDSGGTATVSGSTITGNFAGVSGGGIFIALGGTLIDGGGNTITGNSPDNIISILLNLATGLDASNNLITTGGQPDAHWSVQPQVGGIVPAQTVYPDNPDYFGLWVTNGPKSDWIARDANAAFQGSAPYTFTRTFDFNDRERS